MKKVVYINGRFLTQKITGVQRYAMELLTQLDNLIKTHYLKNEINFQILVPRGTDVNKLKLKNITVKEVGILKGHAWEQLELPFYVRNRLLVNFCNVAPMFKKNQIVTIHDAAVYANPFNFSFIFRTWYKIVYKNISKYSKKIITVSTFSKKELIKYCKVNESKVKVIYEGKEHFLIKNRDSEILNKYKLVPKSYILAVSSLNPNKNFKAVINAFKKLESEKIKFVIAGGTNPRIFNNKLDLSFYKNVVHVGYISDEELKELYENAFCFIYPSFYEGFGLPPLEAMACGCPVIVSNAASLPEVCGDAALYVDPYSPEDIAEKIKLLLSDDKLREELRRKGLERAKMFSWEKCVEETIKVIEEVLAK